MKKPVSRSAAGILAAAEHLFAAAVLICAILLTAGQSIVLPGPNGERTYALWESDRTRAYEDSLLFENIFANNLAAVAEYVAVCSQLETNGVYDGDKVIDVTAFINRGTTLADDYITARYTAANLLKWAQNGFSYEDRAMTPGQSARFLADHTTWTHIINNSVSGGMNGYLNAQIEGNVELRSGEAVTEGAYGDYAFYDDLYDEDTEIHSVLINRYKTVDGYTIEELVSNWNDYQALCSNVVETAQSLYRNYARYQDWKEYYAEDHAQMRYYIVRSIGGRQEIYTNVSALFGVVSTESVAAYFDGLSRSLYYCPYDLTYAGNFAIDEETVRGMFNKAYSAFYPDQIRVWAGVDLAMATGSDDFTAGRAQSQKYLPTSQAIRLMAAIFAALWFITLTLRAVLAGHVFPKAEAIGAKDGKLFLYPFDRWPTELIILLTAFLTIGGYLYFSLSRFLLPEAFRESARVREVLDVLRIVFVSATFSCGLLSLVRKRKASRLLRDSLFCRARDAAKRTVQFTASHTNLAVSTWAPYVAFVLLNFAVPSVLFHRQSAFRVPAVIFLAAFDLSVGVALYHTRMKRREIIEGLERVGAGETDVTFPTEEVRGENRRLAIAAGDVGAGIEQAVSTSMQDERLKAELITNVSHDIKTPLTSIINYVDLLKREAIDNDRAQDYIRVLEEKAQQLKRLTNDLVEASKISSGSIEVTLSRLDLVEFIHQTLGEFAEKFEERGLTPVFRAPKEPVFVLADADHLWRVMENLFGNAAKYAMANTRIYLDLMPAQADDARHDAVFSIRNVSEKELHVDPQELTERFIRGDESRTSEGSGLGLSIADNLTKAQGGAMEIEVDGDLFKVTIWIPADENGEA